jgi:ribosomal protein S19
LALAEAVHEEDLRREQEGLRTKTAAERDGEKGFCVRTWLRRSMVRPLPLWVAKKRM